MDITILNNLEFYFYNYEILSETIGIIHKRKCQYLRAKEKLSEK